MRVSKPRLEVVVGFDAEWVDASHEDTGVLPHKENRILSWQLFLIEPTSGAHCSLFVKATRSARSSRRKLTTLLALLVRDALKCGVLLEPPHVIYLATHFSRADLSTLRDYPLLKRKFSAIRKTYATVLKPYTCDILIRGGLHRISIRLVDTMLIGPAGSSLASLGDALKLQKVELPAGYSKDRMDLFMRDHPALFERYAIVDAEIAARWAVRVFQLARNELGVNRKVATLGGVGVSMIEAEISKLGLDVDHFFGRGVVRRPASHGAHWQIGFAAGYYGGRTRRFLWLFSRCRSHSLRPRPCRRIHDRDGDDPLPDWNTARFVSVARRIATIDDAMTFAHSLFSTGTRFPSLSSHASRAAG
jgi:hypothetical protein